MRSVFHAYLQTEFFAWFAALGAAFLIAAIVFSILLVPPGADRRFMARIAAVFWAVVFGIILFFYHDRSSDFDFGIFIFVIKVLGSFAACAFVMRIGTWIFRGVGKIERPHLRVLSIFFFPILFLSLGFIRYPHFKKEQSKQASSRSAATTPDPVKVCAFSDLKKLSGCFHLLASQYPALEVCRRPKGFNQKKACFEQLGAAYQQAQKLSEELSALAQKRTELQKLQGANEGAGDVPADEAALREQIRKQIEATVQKQIETRSPSGGNPAN